MKEEVQKIIFQAIREMNEGLDISISEEQGLATHLFGDGGILDSIGLVSLVVSVEQNLQDELGISISLADERAMSQKNSPFLTVGRLVDYTLKLIDELQ